MTNLAQTFHTMPRAGGLLDQDSLQMYLMTQVTQAQNELQDKENKDMERRARSGAK